MYGVLMIVHLLICISLIGVVLLQSGKGGGLAGGAFGGSAQTVFGGRGATDFITRATMVLGAAFFLSSLTLALLSSGVVRQTHSLIQEEARRSGAATPATLPPPGSAPGTVSGTAAPPAPSQASPPASPTRPSGTQGQAAPAKPAGPPPPGGH